ncbi:flavodoxin [Fusibacter paucivorans]|uniref:Flavodoxin n=1 Tax=Fusibacter paucivorans TaxID=76009 RepID=A0ABS5PWA9_9FIRM|nr:flavodoxin [Fusibacter paucivorans]MBS7528587.1 flavodoxin [Fusibacter paucivorans]
MSKVLIAFFSRKGNNYVNGVIKDLEVGNTEKVANTIQVLTGGDLFHIEPVDAYDADYHECAAEAKKDLRANARPAFQNPLKAIDDYDTVYLGYPNYWGTMPMHVWTFLEQYDFADKVIMPFCTHEGSGLGRSEKDIAGLCPKAKVESGLAVNGGDVENAQAKVETWIRR